MSSRQCISLHNQSRADLDLGCTLWATEKADEVQVWSWSVCGVFVKVGGAERDADGDDFLVFGTAQPVASGS